MKFEKILIVYSEKLSNKHKETVERVRSITEKYSLCCVERADKLYTEVFEGVDLVITVGGDGAFIRASSFIKEAFIVGINSEPETSEGALLSLKESELEFLEDILNGKFDVLRRERLKIKINDKVIENLALNEVYVGSQNQFHTSRYVIKFNGKSEEQRSSGVLISTCSGSSAWYKSAGGVVFKEDVAKFLVREPFFSRIFNPKLLSGEVKKEEKIEFESRRHNGGVVAIDSNFVYDFHYGDKVEVQISEFPLNVIIKRA